MDLGLKGRGVIVAASSQGIGLATAEAFAREGAQVAMCARTEKTLLEAAGQTPQPDRSGDLCRSPGRDRRQRRPALYRAGGKAVRADRCLRRQCRRASGQEFPLHLRRRMAQSRGPQPDEHGASGQGRDSLHAAPSLGTDHYHYFNLGKQPIADLVLSNSVRAAVVGLVKSLSNEFGKDGILVNNVAPGYTATERLQELAQVRALAAGSRPAADLRFVGRGNPGQAPGNPKEIADVIVWLASERASYVTGQTILADGGIYRGL